MTHKITVIANIFIFVGVLQKNSHMQKCLWLFLLSEIHCFCIPSVANTFLKTLFYSQWNNLTTNPSNLLIVKVFMNINERILILLYFLEAVTQSWQKRIWPSNDLQRSCNLCFTLLDSKFSVHSISASSSQWLAFIFFLKIKHEGLLMEILYNWNTYSKLKHNF